MGIEYHQSYLGQLRQLIGKRKMFSISARAVVENEQGHILLVQRSDNNLWVMPAGSIELEESILACVKREVFEETGLTVISAEAFAIYSDPRFSFTTAYGDPYQMFSTVFWVTEWEGELLTHTDETINAAFFAPDALPPLPDFYHETLADLAHYRQSGQFILK